MWRAMVHRWVWRLKKKTGHQKLSIISFTLQTQSLYLISVPIGSRATVSSSWTTVEDIKQLAQLSGSTRPTGLVNRRY